MHILAWKMKRWVRVSSRCTQLTNKNAEPDSFFEQRFYCHSSDMIVRNSWFVVVLCMFLYLTALLFTLDGLDLNVAVHGV